MTYTISSIIKFLVENREALSKSKFSGVNLVENYMDTGESFYRVHENAFIPRFISSMTTYSSEFVAKVVEDLEIDVVVEWDKPTLWLTIAK